MSGSRGRIRDLAKSLQPIVIGQETRLERFSEAVRKKVLDATTPSLEEDVGKYFANAAKTLGKTYPLLDPDAWDKAYRRQGHDHVFNDYKQWVHAFRQSGQPRSALDSLADHMVVPIDAKAKGKIHKMMTLVDPSTIDLSDPMMLVMDVWHAAAKDWSDHVVTSEHLMGACRFWFKDDELRKELNARIEGPRDLQVLFDRGNDIEAIIDNASILDKMVYMAVHISGRKANAISDEDLKSYIEDQKNVERVALNPLADLTVGIGEKRSLSDLDEALSAGKSGVTVSVLEEAFEFYKSQFIPAIAETSTFEDVIQDHLDARTRSEAYKRVDMISHFVGRLPEKGEAYEIEYQYPGTTGGPIKALHLVERREKDSNISDEPADDFEP